MEGVERAGRVVGVLLLLFFLFLLLLRLLLLLLFVLLVPSRVPSRRVGKLAFEAKQF